MLWSGIAISLSFLAFRIFVRIKTFRRIYADDFLVLTAGLMFFASALVWQSQHSAFSEQLAFSSGTVIPTPEELAAVTTCFRAEFAILGIYYTSLWIVKLSFLVFFRRLGQNVQGQKIWWWCVTGFTVATWATCIGTIDFKCFLRSLTDIYGRGASLQIGVVTLNACAI